MFRLIIILFGLLFWMSHPAFSDSPIIGGTEGPKFVAPLIMKSTSTPANPSAGYSKLYINSVDGKLYRLTSAGVSVDVEGNPLPNFTSTRVLFGDGTNTPVTSSALTFNSGTGALTATSFIGDLVGNALTATALASNPTDCSSDTYATSIAANGNLTCATVSNAGLAGSIDASKIGDGSVSTTEFQYINSLTGNVQTALDSLFGRAPPSGGSTDQVLAKNSNTDYDFKWFTIPTTAITALTGDGTASGPGSSALTLATVNSNVGSFGGADKYTSFTVNAKGLVTAASQGSISIGQSQVTNLVSDLAGKQATGNYITALTGDVSASGPGSSAATIATGAVTSGKILDGTIVNADVAAAAGIGVTKLEALGGDKMVITDSSGYLKAVDSFAVSQAYKIGSAKWTGASNCFWSTSSTSFGNFGADSDCSTPSVTGAVTAPGTKIPAVVLSNLPPGTLMVVASGAFYKGGTVDSAVQFRFHDGTSAFGTSQIYGGTAIESGPVLVGSIDYASGQSSLTINIQGRTGSASNQAYLAADSAGVNDLEISVFFFPSYTQRAVRNDANFDTTGMLIPYGTSTCPAGTIAANGDPVSRTTYAALFAKIGTTFGSGDGSTTFNLPNTSGVFLRGTGTQTISSIATPTITLGGIQGDAFQNHAHPFGLDTGTMVNGANGAGGAATNFAKGNGSLNGTMLANGASLDAGSGTPRTSTETRPANLGVKFCIVTDGQRPMPVIQGQVSSNTTGQERVERARITGSATTPTIASQSGAWLTGVARSGAGRYTATIATGMFSQAPSCVWVCKNSGLVVPEIVNDATTTSIETTCVNGSDVGQDVDRTIICMGPR